MYKFKSLSPPVHDFSDSLSVLEAWDNGTVAVFYWILSFYRESG